VVADSGLDSTELLNEEIFYILTEAQIIIEL
jgi:hypothetical protein